MRMGQKRVIGRVEQYFTDTRAIIALCQTFRTRATCQCCRGSENGSVVNGRML